MRKCRRQLNSLLVLAMLILMLGAPTAYAIDDCSLSVIVQDASENPVPDINVVLYPVALGEGAACSLTPEFADLDISAQQLLAAPDAEKAARVFQYAYAKELDGMIKRTSVAGTAEFAFLERGIYLVTESGNQHVSFEPYLVILPAEIDGSLRSDVFSIPKTSETDTKTLMVMVLWDDNMNAAAMRPFSVKVNVLRDGVAFRQVQLRAANDWEHLFYMLPVSGDYTVAQNYIPYYESQTIPVGEGYVIINTYVGPPGGVHPEPPQAHVSVSKIWDDDNNAAGERPASVTVQLIKDSGTVLKTASLSEANHWSYTFTGLNPETSYTVKEIAVANYAATYAGNAATGITITNSYGTTDPGTPPPPIVPEPELIDIPVRVEWYDDDDAAGKRPHVTAVYLIADGNIVSSLRLGPGENANGGTAAPMSLGSGSVWEGVFTGVPADLSYTVWQSAVEEYTTTYVGNPAGGFVVINTYTQGTTDPSVPPDPVPPDPPGPGDQPDQPGKPDKPVDPNIPQTGAEVLPVYLMMALGVVLVLLGIYDVYRGRREEL